MSTNPKWKRSERSFAKWLMEHDGPEPSMARVASSTGRVGHITELQYDVASLHYTAENKAMRVWAGLWSFWLQIVAKSIENGKQPLIRIEPTNDEKFILGRRVPKLHIITEERHAELLGYEKDALAKLGPAPVIGYSKEEQLRRGRSRARR